MEERAHHLMQQVNGGCAQNRNYIGFLCLLLVGSQLTLPWSAPCATAQDGLLGWVQKQLPYQLPSEPLVFSKLRPESTPALLDLDGLPLLYLGQTSKTRLQIYKPLSAIDPKLIQFVVLLEDAKFFQHTGLDLSEIKKAFQDNLSKRKTPRGGSTISQQLVKNMFLGKEKSYTRKLFEVPWVTRLEKDLSKKQILDLYLNIIEWGPGIYGAEAAARHYFDKSCSDLEISEALALALIIPNPKRFDPYLGPKNLAFVEKKKKSFLDRLVTEKFVSVSDRRFMENETLKLAPLNQTQRNYPLLHSGNYYPHRKSPEGQQDLLQFLLNHLGRPPQSLPTQRSSLSKNWVKKLSESYAVPQSTAGLRPWILQHETKNVAFLLLPPEQTPDPIEGLQWISEDTVTWRKFLP